jgi:hypothetical protein
MEVGANKRLQNRGTVILSMQEGEDMRKAKILNHFEKPRII